MSSANRFDVNRTVGIYPKLEGKVGVGHLSQSHLFRDADEHMRGTTDAAEAQLGILDILRSQLDIDGIAV